MPRSFGLRAPRSLLGRLILVTTLFLAVAIGALLWQGIERLRDTIERGEIERIRAIATTLALSVDGDGHRAADRLPDKDSFTEWEDAPRALQQIHEQLAEAVRENGLETGIDTLVVRDAERVETAPHSRIEGAMSVIATSNDPPYYRHSTDYYPEMRDALEGYVVVKRPYADAHGTWISAWAPIRDGDGEVVAILEVDTPLDRFLEGVDRHAGSQVLFAAILLLVVLCGLIVATSKVTQSMRNLSSAARRFGRGDLDTHIEVGAGAREVLEVAEALETARRQLSAELAKRAKHERELADALDKAEAATHVKSQFLANMSHELRTPMNAIIGYSEMLMEDAEDLGQQDFVPDLKKIHSAGTHLLALINDILDLSKVEAGKMELYLEDFDVKDVIDGVCATVGPLVSKKGNELVVEVAVDVGEMHSDLTRVRQVLFNLMSNAAKFTEDGSITVRAQRDDARETIVFEIADTGIGMSARQMKNLFVPFTQADASTTRQYGGTGLGLSLCKQFCDLLGGSVGVSSELGEGSTFRVELPARSERRPSSEVEPERRSSLPMHEPEGVVLVIDDDPAARELMARSLTRGGYAVMMAASGADGLNIAEEKRPDVVVLDVLLPKQDGWEVLTAFKAHPTLNDVPVVLVTMVDDRSRGYALGATDYLTKPVDWDRLHGALKRHIHGSAEVLVVDDEASVRDVLRRQLEREGHTVRLATDGAEALAELEASRPDLVVLDLMMPNVDGFEVLEKLRDDETLRELPVIVFTAMDLEAEDRGRLESGVARILTKGGSGRETLLEEVRAQVDAHMKRSVRPPAA